MNSFDAIVTHDKISRQYFNNNNHIEAKNNVNLNNLESINSEK